MEPLLWPQSPHPVMRTPGTYKSPSKLKRDMRRLLDHLFKSIKKTKMLSSTKPLNLEPRIKPKLTKSEATSTSYPEPCLACNEHHCAYNFSHQVYFTVTAALDEQLNQIGKQKPPDPDDACG